MACLGFFPFFQSKQPNSTSSTASLCCWRVLEQDAKSMWGSSRVGKSCKSKPLLWESRACQWERIYKIIPGTFLLHHMELREETGQGVGTSYSKDSHLNPRCAEHSAFTLVLLFFPDIAHYEAFHCKYPGVVLQIPHLVQQPEVVSVLKALPLCRILLKLFWWGKSTHTHTCSNITAIVL